MLKMFGIGTVGSIHFYVFEVKDDIRILYNLVYVPKIS